MIIKINFVHHDFRLKFFEIHFCLEKGSAEKPDSTENGLLIIVVVVLKKSSRNA